MARTIRTDKDENGTRRPVAARSSRRRERQMLQNSGYLHYEGSDYDIVETRKS